MKILKNKILTVLLLIFAFFVVHDYFIQEHQIAKHGIIHAEHDISDGDAQSHMHEAIHSIWSTNCEDNIVIQEKLLDLKPSNLFFSITSNISLVPQRPPSV
ncbi:hypothetical protein FJR48_09895 [Sulfurimonas lithotrophica]|uniref:Uncharacterized protein n=1 Tax=Sulfurimonas lithotrophica TaxID=2590022 RepID=A0A5P8P2T3_9BACT|nr:hypothetical protein [Sulfurimonas lithotrophica]QFR50019.1 hypothetical protein FJR48_09895 [Sulfurimonas lithotrophica]